MAPSESMDLEEQIMRLRQVAGPTHGTHIEQVSNGARRRPKVWNKY